MERTEDRIKQWQRAPFDEETIAQVKGLSDEERTEAFYKDLEFGTGGLRGLMGVGPNRINKYTVGRATQGFSNYLKKAHPGRQVKVAIGYDSRNNSKSLAKVVADVFSANGIKVYLFAELRPTPLLSFAIRELGCAGGVMLTASHNPKEYNGYKAYGSDGGQLVAPVDRQVMDQVQALQDMEAVNFEGDPSLIEDIGGEMDESYFRKILAYRFRPEVIEREKDLCIVYSALHGTGITMVPQALAKWGFRNVKLQKEQSAVSGDFPTVVYPNPEEADALELAVKDGGQAGADLIMATDPDCDRVGVVVRSAAGEFVPLNGNQIGSLIVDYVIGTRKEKGTLPGNGFAVKTIVTTPLIGKIADAYGVPCPEVLTGFKYIGEKMTLLEGKQEFLVGGEESYGYLIGDLVRDKDAVISCTVIAEIAAWYKSKGKTLLDALEALYSKFGVYQEKLISLTKQGKAGSEEIAAMMRSLRQNPPAELGGVKIVAVKDYENSIEKELATGETSSLDLPRSNVLQFISEKGDIISARPSGTEPKIKFYCSVRGEYTEGRLKEINDVLTGRIDRMMKDLLSN